MDTKTQGLVKLFDEALKMAEERLLERQAGNVIPQAQGEMEKIISGIRYRREQAVNGEIEPSEGYITLGIVRVVTENDHWDTPLARKAKEIEEYYLKVFR